MFTSKISKASTAAGVGRGSDHGSEIAPTRQKCYERRIKVMQGKKKPSTHTSGESVLMAAPMPEEVAPFVDSPTPVSVFLFVCGPVMVVKVLRACDAMCQAMLI